MKLSKTNKLLLLFSAFILAIAVAFSFVGINSVKADGTATYEVTSSVFKIDSASKTITLARGTQYNKTDLVVKKTQVVDGSTKVVTVGFDDVEELAFNSTVANKIVKKDTKFAINEKISPAEDFFTVGGETYKVEVIDDEKAPEFKVTIDDAVINALNGQIKVLDDTAKFFDADGIEKNCYKPIGYNKYIELPSFENYIKDDTTPYKKLKYKVYYKVNSLDTYYNSSTTVDGKFQIPVKEEGKYTFFVTFIDVYGNETDVEDAKKLTLNFEIYDNYPIKVEIGANHQTTENGYLNETYKGTNSLFKFTGVDSSRANYKILYAEENEEANFKTLEEAGFTEDEIKEINFKTSDLSFKPSKEGYYKITCSVSNVSETAKDSNEVVIHVTEKPVEPENDENKTTFWGWVSEHLLAVVFFGIALVCLVAIIVLLLVKPKNESVDNKEDTKNN